MAKKHLRVNKRIVLTTIGVVVLLAGALAVGVLVQRVLKPGAGPIVSEDAKTGGLPDVPADATLPAEITEIQNLRLTGKEAEADKKIEEALQKNVNNDSMSYRLYIQQGISHENKGQMQLAYDSYAKAQKLKKTYEIYVLLGDTAVALGKKQEAIDSYKTAITLISPDSPLKDADKRRLEQKIRDLGGQP